jgi:hypothetical protein
MRKGVLLTQERTTDIDYKESKRGYSVSSIGEETSERSPVLFDKRIWRVKDVADFLNCSIGHIYNLTSDEKIPKIKKGKFL